MVPIRTPSGARAAVMDSSNHFTAVLLEALVQNHDCVHYIREGLFDYFALGEFGYLLAKTYERDPSLITDEYIDQLAAEFYRQMTGQIEALQLVGITDNEIREMQDAVVSLLFEKDGIENLISTSSYRAGNIYEQRQFVMNSGILETNSTFDWSLTSNLKTLGLRSNTTKPCTVILIQR